MSKIRIIAGHEFITAVKRLSYIILTLSLPLLATLGMLAYYGITQWASEKQPVEKPSIGYVDNTGLFDDYTNTEALDFVPYISESEARQGLFDGNISEYFVIPADYLDTGLIDRYITKREIEPPYATLNSIEDFMIANLIGADVSDDVLARVSDPLYTQSFRLNPDTGEISPPDDEISSFVMPYIFEIGRAHV